VLELLNSTVILGNSLTRWLISLLVALATMAAVGLWRWIVGRRLRNLIRTNTFFDEVGVVLVEKIASPIVLLLAIYVGSLFLAFDPLAKLWLRSLALILVLIQIGIWGQALIERWMTRYEERNRETNAANVGTARLLSVLVRFGLFALITLLILDNIPGVEITPLLAGLGIGGIAVALAVQNILSDVLASLSITLDKPFVLGDFIAVGDDMGTVERIGLKTTRVRSVSGEQLIFANNDLLGSRVRNFQRLEQRRIVFSFRVAYETPPERLRAIPSIVQSFIEAHDNVRFDRASLLRFDDVGLFYEVVYFVTIPDFARYIAIQHAVNMALLERFEAEGIAFANLANEAAIDRRTRGRDAATP
jgi:small-conductance mechanosensitive channel